MDTQKIISLLALVTLFSNIFFVILVIIYTFLKLGILPTKKGKKYKSLFHEVSLKMAFLISLTATSGSLFFSEIAGLVPCRLCWYQRIFMYPLPVIIAVSVVFNLKDVFKYILPLSLIGLLIAGYHYFYQIFGIPSLTCSAFDSSVSCFDRAFTHYGYITISWMSFSAFAYVFLLSLLGKNTN